MSAGSAPRSVTPALLARKDAGMRTSAGRRGRYAPAALGIAVAVLAAWVLAACGSAGGSTAPATNPPPRAAVFIDLLAALPGSLDPADELGPAFDRLESSLASTLVRPAGRPSSSATLAPAEDVDGLLASSWTELGNGDYVFELRRGVRSAYGHELGARDVQFSFTRELARSAAARALAGVAGIALRDPVTVLGPARVRVNVTAPGALTLAILGDFHFGVLDRRAVEAHAPPADPSAHAWLAGHLAFYGAYALSEFDPARKLLLHASPHGGAAPAFGTLAIEAVPSATVRVSDLGAAVASHTGELDRRSFVAAARTNGLLAEALPSTTVATLVPNERFRPFASVLVRRAFSLAIDRAAIARGAFGGFARPAEHPVPSTIALPLGLAQPTYTHDLARARDLLSRAGYPRGFTVVLAVTAADGPELTAAIAGELGRIGVSVHTRRVRSSREAARWARGGTVGGVLESADAPIASAPFEILANYLGASPGNIEGYDSSALDALRAALAGSAPGSATGTAALQRALTIVATTVPVIPLVEIPSQNVTLASIRGYAAYANQATYYDRLKR